MSKYSTDTIKDIVEWDVPNWWRAIDFWSTTWPPSASFAGKKALILGDRAGGLSLYWALQGAHVTYSDLTDDNFENARRLHQKYGIDNIDYQVVDATAMAFDSEYDLVSFKSVLGALGNLKGADKRKLALSNIHKALTPNGTLYFVENLAASPLHQYLRHKYVEWGDTWKYLKREELPGLAEGFDILACQTFGFWGAMGSRMKLSGLAGALDRAFDQLIKDDNRYIASCILRAHP